jgi:hypothetical protein
LTLDPKHSFVTALEKSHGHKLRRYLAARLRNTAADVPDLVQEVFLRLLRLDDHEAIRNSQAYLYTVASHVLHQHALRQTASGETAMMTGRSKTTASIRISLWIRAPPQPASATIRNSSAQCLWSWIGCVRDGCPICRNTRRFPTTPGR